MKLKLLLVDDKIPFLDTAIRYLNFNKDIKMIGWALTGQDAIEKVKKFRPDLILIDLSLPDSNGLNIIREIKNINVNQKIVVLTLHDQSEYRTEAKTAGADGFISKADFATQFPPLLNQLFGNY